MTWSVDSGWFDMSWSGWSEGCIAHNCNAGYCDVYYCVMLKKFSHHSLVEYSIRDPSLRHFNGFGGIFLPTLIELGDCNRICVGEDVLSRSCSFQILIALCDYSYT